jgi:hypothetical protein
MLTLNGKEIPVDKSFKVRISAANPVCDFEKLPGNAGLGIRIPVNEYSRAYFGNPERYEKYSAASTRKFAGVELRKEGVLLEAGSLVINGADAQYYDAWLQPELGVMGEELQDTFINKQTWPEGVVFTDKAEYDPATDEYAKIYIKNEMFWEGKGAEGPVIIPYTNDDGEPDEREEVKNYLTDASLEYFENVVNGPALGAETDYANVVSPYLFFRYMLKEVLRTNRFYIRSHPFDQIGGVNKLVVYNNFSIYDPEPGNTSDRNFTTFDRRANSYTTVSRERIDTLVWQLKPFNYADLVPKISIKDFLLGIQNYLNVAFDFLPDRTVKIIDREAIITGPALLDVTPYQVSEWRKIGEKRKTSLKFIPQYDKEDANFGDQFHDLSDRWRDFKAPVDTYNNLLVITSRHNPEADRTLGQLRYVRDENKIYEYKWMVQKTADANGTEEQTNILGWEFVSSGPQYYVFRNGDPEEEIKTAISTLQMENGLLTARQRGNVNAMRNLWCDFSFRMFFYTGVNSGSVDNIADGLSCNWEGTNGIFNKRWRNWASFWANCEPLEADFLFPLNVWQYIKNNRTSKFRTEKGEFIIELMDTDFSLAENGLTTLKIWRK